MGCLILRFCSDNRSKVDRKRNDIISPVKLATPRLTSSTSQLDQSIFEIKFKNSNIILKLHKKIFDEFEIGKCVMKFIFDFIKVFPPIALRYFLPMMQ